MNNSLKLATFTLQPITPALSSQGHVLCGQSDGGGSEKDHVRLWRFHPVVCVFPQPGRPWHLCPLRGEADWGRQVCAFNFCVYVFLCQCVCLCVFVKVFIFIFLSHLLQLQQPSDTTCSRGVPRLRRAH